MFSIEQITRKSKSAWNNFWKSDGQEDMDTHIDETAVFELKYKDLLIGTLTLKSAVWTFGYSEIFKHQNVVQPLPDFPDVNRVYQRSELYPFFLIRIPSLKQPKVQEEIKEKNIDSSSTVDLLKLFGQKSIANPFLLVPV